MTEQETINTFNARNARLTRLRVKLTHARVTAAALTLLLVFTGIYARAEYKAADAEKTTAEIYADRAANWKAQAESTAAELETVQAELQTANANIEAAGAADPLQLVYLGEYKCTAYCCEKYAHICGTGDGITASGAPVTAGVTVAAASDLPFGTWLYIDGVGLRQVQDRGQAVGSMQLDVAVKTHAEALSWDGYGTHAVYVVEGL